MGIPNRGLGASSDVLALEGKGREHAKIVFEA